MTTTTEFALDQVAQISVRVQDLERATDFYRNTLGMRNLFAGPKMSFFQCGTIRLILGTPESEEFDHPSSILYFKVPDINAAYETLRSRGVHFEHEPIRFAAMATFDLWMAFFRDSENNLMSLMCEVAKSKKTQSATGT